VIPEQITFFVNNPLSWPSITGSCLCNIHPKAWPSSAYMTRCALKRCCHMNRQPFSFGKSVQKEDHLDLPLHL